MGCYQVVRLTARAKCWSGQKIIDTLGDKWELMSTNGNTIHLSHPSMTAISMCPYIRGDRQFKIPEVFINGEWEKMDDKT